MAFMLDSINGLFKLLFGCDLPDDERVMTHFIRTGSTKSQGNLTKIFHPFRWANPAKMLGEKVPPLKLQRALRGTPKLRAACVAV